MTRLTAATKLALAIGLASPVLLIGATANAAATTLNANVQNQLNPTERCPDGANLCAAAELLGYGHANSTLTLVALAPRHRRAASWPRSPTSTRSADSRSRTEAR